MTQYEPRFMISYSESPTSSGGAAPLRPEDVVEALARFLNNAHHGGDFNVVRLSEDQIKGWADMGVANCQLMQE